MLACYESCNQYGVPQWGKLSWCRITLGITYYDYRHSAGARRSQIPSLGRRAAP